MEPWWGLPFHRLGAFKPGVTFRGEELIAGRVLVSSVADDKGRMLAYINVHNHGFVEEDTLQIGAALRPCFERAKVQPHMHASLLFGDLNQQRILGHEA